MTWGMGSAYVEHGGHTVGAAIGNKSHERHRAARAVAAASRDAGECAALLEMLGLTASEGKAKVGAS